MNIEKHRKLKIDWLGKCPKCERSTVTVSTINGSLEKLFDGDKVECWCGQTGEIDTGDNNAWVEWDAVLLSNKDNHDYYYREKYPDYWDRLPGCNHQAWTHYETSLNSWLVALHRAEAKPNKDFDEFFNKRHGELPVDTTSEKYADMSYLKHEMKKTWQIATTKLEGYVVVPEKANKTMLHAGYEVHDRFFTNGEVQDVWVAMVEAARGGK